MRKTQGHWARSWGCLFFALLLPLYCSATESGAEDKNGVSLNTVSMPTGHGSISRQIDKVLPRYVDADNGMDDDHDGRVDEFDELDTFVGPDGEELVRLADGTCLIFGESEETRVDYPSGKHIFKWMLEKNTDVNGHVIQYFYDTYPNSDNRRYLKEIRWGPGPPGAWQAYNFTSLLYEDRSDWRTDYRSGFLVKTSKQLVRIDIGIHGLQPQSEQCQPLDRNGDGANDSTLISRYILEYDDSTGVSFLAKITRPPFPLPTPLSYRWKIYQPRMPLSPRTMRCSPSWTAAWPNSSTSTATVWPT